jgi:hypothetical protein
MTFTIDSDKQLIKEPCVTEVGMVMPNFIGVLLTEYQAPLANSLIIAYSDPIRPPIPM